MSGKITLSFVNSIILMKMLALIVSLFVQHFHVLVVTVLVCYFVPHSILVLHMLSGYLQLNGLRVQRAHIRTALMTADPAAAASRWSRTVARRSYHVSAPNSLWHIDSHLKLVR